MMLKGYYQENILILGFSLQACRKNISFTFLQLIVASI